MLGMVHAVKKKEGEPVRGWQCSGPRAPIGGGLRGSRRFPEAHGAGRIWAKVRGSGQGVVKAVDILFLLFLCFQLNCFPWLSLVLYHWLRFLLALNC